MRKLLTSLILLSVMSLTFIACEEKKPLGEERQRKSIFYYKKSEMDPRLKRYPEAIMMYEEAGSSPASAFDLGLFYEDDLGDYNEAIVWYTRAYDKDYLKAANNMAIIYRKLKDYDNAIKWYEISISRGITASYINLAVLYHHYLKNNEKAVKYYNLDIKLGHSQPINNMGVLYADNNEPIKASAYFINLIKYRSNKEEMLTHLRDELKYSEETIKKGYELQLTMPGLIYRYKGRL